MPEQLNVGNKLIPGTQGAFTQQVGPTELETKLTEEMALARRRAERSATETGAQFVEGEGELGFTPTALRVKKKQLFKKEIQDVQSAMNSVIEDIMNETTFTDERQRASKRMKLTQRAGQVQKILLQTGLNADMQIQKAQIAQSEKDTMYAAFAGIASSIGYGIAMRKPSAGGGGGETQALTDTPQLSTSPGFGKATSTGREAMFGGSMGTVA
jgi:hypothetical protein